MEIRSCIGDAIEYLLAKKETKMGERQVYTVQRYGYGKYNSKQHEPSELLGIFETFEDAEAYVKCKVVTLTPRRIVNGGSNVVYEYQIGSGEPTISKVELPQYVICARDVRSYEF